MNYVEAPAEYSGNGLSIFFAGSISDESNWQKSLTEVLVNDQVTIFNPRRKQFPAGDRSEMRRQITWERQYLAEADVAVFWFTPPTLCPIALFELGACCGARVPMVVGIAPDYALRFDVVTHLNLWRSDLAIHDSLTSMAIAIANCVRRQGDAR